MAALGFQTLLRGSAETDGDEFLYPLALEVPGPQHIIDLCLRECVEKISWWPRWSTQSKFLCQWLHSVAHRDFLRSRLVDSSLPAASVISLSDSLQKGVDRFAKWRWKTLSSVTTDLARVEEAVRSSFTLLGGAAQLGTRDLPTATAVWNAAIDDQFWRKARLLGAFAAPLKKLSSWVRGCPCHEEARLRGHPVECQWAGCRAPQFADKLRSTRAEILALRSNSGALNEEDSACMLELTTKLVGALDIKFAWVNDPPYLIWEARRISNRQGESFGSLHDLKSGGCASPLNLKALMEPRWPRFVEAVSKAAIATKALFVFFGLIWIFRLRCVDSPSGLQIGQRPSESS